MLHSGSFGTSGTDLLGILLIKLEYDCTRRGVIQDSSNQSDPKRNFNSSPGLFKYCIK